MSDPGLVQKTVAVMSCVAAHPTGIGLSDVARQVGLPKATCYRVLTALEAEGWLETDDVSRRFRVALGFLLLSQQHVGPGSIAQFIKALLRELSASASETAGLDRLEGDSVMVLAEVAGPHLIRHTPRTVPRLLPAWRTSTGKALLAWSDRLPERSLVDADLAVNPSPSMADFDDLLAELEMVRERGFATAYDELEVGLAAVAAPVHVGEAAPYAVWIGGPAFRMPEADLDRLAIDVIDAARKLSSVLGRDGAAAEVAPLGLLQD
jgi:IclR family transcriptional regulator, acetate operon repressor